MQESIGNGCPIKIKKEIFYRAWQQFYAAAGLPVGFRGYVYRWVIMGMAGMHKEINTSAAGDVVYMAAAALYMLKAFCGTTLFYLAFPADYDNMLRVFLCASIFLKFIHPQGHTRADAMKKWLLCIIVAVLFKFSWMATGYAFLLDTALLAVGAADIPYRKILKTGFWVGVYVLLIAMLGSFTGCITDLVYSSNGRFRHSFGIVYPTDFAAHVLFLALSGWTLYGGVSAMPAVIAAALAAFTGYYCKAKCSTAVLCLLAAAMLYHSFTAKKNRKSKMANAAAERIDSFMPYAMPLCAVLMIILTSLYEPNSGLMSHIDTLLTNRLSLGRTAIDTYGVKLFGTAFEQVGFGGGTAWTWAYKYNFIDSSYILILVRYGLMVLLALCVLNILAVKKALGNGDRRIALAVTLMAVHSMAEHHLPEVAYNLFLLLPFAGFQPEKKMPGQKPVCINSKSYAPCMVLLAGGAAVVIAFPRAVGYLKTMVDILHLDAQENRIWFFGIAAVSLAAAHLLLWVAVRIVALSMRGKTVRKAAYAGLCILPITILCIVLLGEPVIRQAQEDSSSLIEWDRPIIEALLAEKNSVGRLYVNHMPEAYKREFRGLSSMVLAAEGLVHKRNATLITEDMEELDALIDAGYAYGEISPQHAVYTNSAAAKSILEKAGIRLTDYYSRQRTVDLADMAASNSLEMTERQTLLLNGSGKSLAHGSGNTVYKGILRVEYQIRLVCSTIQEGVAATAKITSDWGKRTWGGKDISLSDFDENGQCTVVVDANLIFSCPNMEFLLLVQDGVELEVQEIRYGKVE